MAATKKYGVVAGIHTNTSDYALKMIQKGFQFVTHRTRLLALALSEVVRVAEAGMPEAGPY